MATLSNNFRAKRCNHNIFVNSVTINALEKYIWERYLFTTKQHLATEKVQKVQKVQKWQR